jgi:hypothetical protein
LLKHLQNLNGELADKGNVMFFHGATGAGCERVLA